MAKTPKKQSPLLCLLLNTYIKVTRSDAYLPKLSLFIYFYSVFIMKQKEIVTSHMMLKDAVKFTIC